MKLYLDFLHEEVAKAIEKEREACISVIKRYLEQSSPWEWEEVIEAIKERGDTK